MAVNYGLGGFKDGAAYMSAYSEGVLEAEIADVDTPVSIKNTLLTTNFLLAEVDAGVDYQLNLYLSGFWLINYSITSAGGDNDNFTCGLGVEESVFLAAGKQSFNSKAGDYFTTNCTSIIKVDSSFGTSLFMLIENNSDDSNVSLENVNITAIRIGDLLEGSGTGKNQYKAGTAYGSLYFDGSTALSYGVVDTFYAFGLTYQAGYTCGVHLYSTSFLILQSGFYLYNCSISTSGSSNDDLVLGIFKNGTDQDNLVDYATQSFNSKGGSLWQTGLSTMLYLKAGDIIQPCIANATDTSGNTTFKHVNLNLVRLGNI